MNQADMSESEYKLANVLSSYDSLAIAFSGGIDSSLLAFMANKYVKGKILLINVSSPFSTSKEAIFVEKWAKEQNYQLEVVKLNLLESEQVKRNPKDRCYYCKKIIMTELKKIALKHGIKDVADGTNMDDLGDYRPGNKASEELGIKHPFIDANITKKEIRKLAKENNLENWDTPPSACLATRIPFGTPIEESDLRRIEKAEEYLHQFGYMNCRVRLIGNFAKIELPLPIIDEMMPLRQEIVEKFKNLGFKGVFLDLEGYRQGAMNEGI